MKRISRKPFRQRRPNLGQKVKIVRAASDFFGDIGLVIDIDQNAEFPYMVLVVVGTQHYHLFLERRDVEITR